MLLDKSSLCERLLTQNQVGYPIAVATAHLLYGFLRKVQLLQQAFLQGFAPGHFICLALRTWPLVGLFLGRSKSPTKVLGRKNQTWLKRKLFLSAAACLHGFDALKQ